MALQVCYLTSLPFHISKAEKNSTHLRGCDEDLMNPHMCCIEHSAWHTITQYIELDDDSNDDMGLTRLW